MMRPNQPMAQTQFLIEGQPVVIQCTRCESMIKEVMAQDRLMAQLKRDLRNLEVLINKTFGVDLNMRSSRELRLRDRSTASTEIRPYLHRQDKIKIAVSPRAKFARLRELRQRVQPSRAIQTMPEFSFDEEHNIEEAQPFDPELFMDAE